MLLPLLLSSLVDVEYESVHHSGETKVLVFDLADVAKALAQFEHSSEALSFILNASPEATKQFEQATKVEEAFLRHCLRLCLDCFVFAFGYAGAAALSLNMVDVGLHQILSSVAGGCYEPSCDTLPQPLTLTFCCRAMIIRRPTEVVRHLMEDAYNLNEPFVGCMSCLVYESSHGTICSFASKETLASMFLLFCSIVYWLLVGLASPWCSSGGRDVKMHWLGLALGEAAGIYSLLPIRFNKSWWLADVYCLDAL